MIQKRLVNLEANKPVLQYYMKHSKTSIYILFFSVLAFLLSCANPVAPTGGPKDTTPPKALKFDPPNFSTNFRDNTIKIDFDEFIALKNQSAEVNISPPQKTPPDLKLRGKSLLVKLADTLASNMTYSIDFGKSISDITENNALTGFSYVFSTGPYIDSLSLRGTVQNAFDLSPQKDVFALLYVDRHDTIAFDSLPLKVKPYYVTKTNEKGDFMFHNLRASPMKLTALADLNGNLIFDQATEKVAFSDSLVHPYYMPKPKIDSSALKNDSLKAKTDTAKVKAGNSKVSSERLKIVRDSTKKDSLEKQLAYPNHLLFLFDDIDSIQRIQKSLVVKRGLVLLVFRFPVKAYNLKPLNCDTNKPWALTEFTQNKDSLYLWLTNSGMDSLILRVSQGGKVLDTLKLELNSKDAANARKKDQRKSYLVVSNNTVAASFNQFAGNLSMIFSYPIASANLSRIRLMQEKDTIKPKVHFSDSLKRVLLIDTKWKEDKNYSVFIPDSVFISIHGLTNDTIKYSFKTKQAREFGNLILDIDISKRPGDYLIQLLNEKDIVLAEKKIQTSGKVKFENLVPGKFKVKGIYDRNHNGHWDTGNFRKKIQPEEVFFLQKTLEIRANWDVEEKWTPGQTSEL